MRALIRFLRRGPAGALDQKDKLYDGEVVTLGRATDQVVQCKDRRVALAHARIILRSGQPVVLSHVPGGVLVNGTLQREARLRVGDTVTLGANILRILEPPAGCDVAFSFELDADARSDDVASEPLRLRLGDLGFSKRRWSWALFLGVLLVSLAIPTAGVRSPAVQASLRASLLPDDHFWSPGPLSRVHAAQSGRCETCHERPFQRVRNEACLTCHATNLHQHANASAGAADETRCASCHSEHQEPAALVRENPAVCVDCHRDLKSVSPATKVTPQVTDFAADHPTFGVPPRVDSGLTFPHDVHLDKTGIRSAAGDKVLGCSDCHVLEAGGARFRSLEMQRDCGDCHLLDFDPAYPDRVVPHGDAQAVTAFLVDYYSRRFLESYADPLAGPVSVRRAGPRPSAAEREQLLRNAREQAGRVTRDLFERRSCSQCHAVTRGGPVGNEWKIQEWRIQAVDLRTTWLPDAKFSHAAHGTALTGCETCHQAAGSKVSTDVLLPVIATCRECHAGGDARVTPVNRITSTCILCHDFHAGEKPLWLATAPAR